MGKLNDPMDLWLVGICWQFWANEFCPSDRRDDTGRIRTKNIFKNVLFMDSLLLEVRRQVSRHCSKQALALSFGQIKAARPEHFQMQDCC